MHERERKKISYLNTLREKGSTFPDHIFGSRKPIFKIFEEIGAGL